MQSTRGTMHAVDREVQNVIGGLQVLALSPELQSNNLAAFRMLADAFVSRFPPGHNMVLTDRSGQQVMNTGAPEGQALPMRTDRETVARLFASGKPVVSPVFMGALLNRPIFTVDVPVRIGGELLYDLSFNPPIETFQQIIERQSLPADWIMSVFDRNGTHVARRPSLPARGLTTAAPSLRAEMEQGDQGISETVTLEGTRVLSAFVRSPESSWIVAAGIPSNTLAAPAWRSLLLTTSVGALFLAIGLSFAVRLATQLARAEAHRELLMNEVNHRVKNTLSTVQYIVSRTLRRANVEANSKKAVEGQLIALARAHNVLTESHWETASLRVVIASVLEPYLGRDKGMLRLDGPDLKIQPRAAVIMAMIINELATNAVKYGSLAAESGQVALSWRIGQEMGQKTIWIDWQERGGPSAPPSEDEGFGSVLIARSITEDLRGKVERAFTPSGIRWKMQIPLSEMTGPAGLLKATTATASSSITRGAA